MKSLATVFPVHKKLISVSSFFIKLGIESRKIGKPAIEDRRTPSRQIVIHDGTAIFIEMLDGSVYGGILQRQENHVFPVWIGSGNRGRIRVYVQGPTDNGFNVINLTHLPGHQATPGIVRAYIQIAPNDISYATLRLLDNNNRPDHSRTRVYVLTRNGVTFTGVFE